MKTETDKLEQMRKLSAQIMHVSRDAILMNLRFLDVALSLVKLSDSGALPGIACDGTTLFYESSFVLRRYKLQPSYITRTYLHSLLHMILFHPFRYNDLERKYWDIACDMAVEQIILDLSVSAFKIRDDEKRGMILKKISDRIGTVTAEKLYRSFIKESPDEEILQEYSVLFHRDEHALWLLPEKMEISLTQWKKLAERVKTDLKTFSKGRNGADALEKNLAEATRDRYDYADILKRFTVMGEELHANEDEFDYIYYTLGLERYGNMPLIEPLEYQDVKKIREFIIAIDTSASCRGKIVQAFLQKTYSILKGTENFFSKVNIHIIQCDNEIENDTLITCDADFDDFIKNGKLKGFGATDFRPVFDYTARLIEEKKFENLKGLIYFTDGYGIYPENMPPYDVIFAFLNEDEHRPAVPTWAIKVILEEDELENPEDVPPARPWGTKVRKKSAAEARR